MWTHVHGTNDILKSVQSTHLLVEKIQNIRGKETSSSFLFFFPYLQPNQSVKVTNVHCPQCMFTLTEETRSKDSRDAFMTSAMDGGAIITKIWRLDPAPRLIQERKSVCVCVQHSPRDLWLLLWLILIRQRKRDKEHVRKARRRW